MAQDLKALADTLATAFNAGDMTALTRCYASDAQIHPPGRPPVKGSEQIRAFFSEIRSQGFRHYRLVVDESLSDGERRLLCGRWSLTGFDADGIQRRYEGNWLNVLAQADDAAGDDGAPSIVAHIWN